MRQLGTFFTLAIIAGFVTGCGQMSGSPAASRGGMAVVDLDKVAIDTGRDIRLNQSLETARNSLNETYSKSVESAKSIIDTKKKEFGEQPSDDEKKQLANMERNAVSQLSQIQNAAQAKYEQYKQTQIARFRNELKPIAQEIAAKRGLSIVIPKNEGLLLSVDPGVDITEDVVKVLREKHPVVTPAPEAPASAPKAAAKRTPGSAKPAAQRTAAADDDEEESNR